MSNKVAFFTDLHLGVHIDSSLWHDISIEWCEWFVKQVSKRNIDTIIFGGDWFHQRAEINVKTLNISHKILDILKDFQIYSITGNHDCFYKNNSTIHSLVTIKERNNVTLFDTPTSQIINGVDCFFAPWGTELQDIKKCDIVFGHFEIQNFKLNNFKVCDHGFKSDGLLDKTSCVFTGHFHKREQKQFSNGYIVYGGNPFQMDFSDLGDKKGFYVIDFNDLSYEFVHNDISPTHFKINVSDLLGNQCTSLFNHIKSNKLHIKLTVDDNYSNSQVDDILTKLSSYKPYTLTVDYIHKFITETDEISASQEFNIEQFITNYIDNSVDDKYKNSVKDKIFTYYSKIV